ncbi:MAG: aminotransferase class IV [Balneolales bacterium]|nr:aminotransferase class IV [Balneolales bacterium]
MLQKNLIVYFDGSFMRQSEAVLPANCSALTFGLACFETILVSQYQWLKPEYHLSRFAAGLRALGASEEDLEFISNPMSVGKSIRELIDKNNFRNQDIRVKLLAGRSDADGLSPDAFPTFFFQISADIYKPFLLPLRLCITEWERVPASVLSNQIKWTFYLPSKNALLEAKKRGFDDGILLDQRGYVSETAVSNIGIIKNDEIFIPAETSSALNGVTMRVLKEALNREGLSLQPAQLRIKDLLDADAAFVTSALKGVHPVCQIESHKLFAMHPLLEKVRHCFTTHRKENLSLI